MITPRKMSDQLVIFATFAVLIAMCASAPVRAASSEPRALYIWSMKSGGIYSNSAAQTQLFNFLAAPKGNSANAITTIFCAGAIAGDFTDATMVSQIQNFNAAAHSHGLTVYYLCGDPTWATTNQSVALQYVQMILNYNASSTAAQKFDGFQYDVEPWALAGWPKASQINGWITMLKNAANAIASSGQRLPLQEAISFWLDNARYQYCDRSVIDTVDSVMIMDYVTTAANLVNYPAAEVNYASAHGKGAWIGVETNGPASTSTFYGLGNASMENVLTTALPSYQTQPCYLGYAIDDYTGYVNLGP